MVESSIRAASGDVAEFGVWQGATFLPLAEYVELHNRKAHAVDSFIGMPEPGPLDGDQYPKGRLSVDGSSDFAALTASLGNVVIHEGFVPQILDSIELPDGLCFAHIDLDHCEPTYAALRWCWRRLNKGGIIAGHDWLPEREPCILATAAYKRFNAETGLFGNALADSRHIYWMKP